MNKIRSRFAPSPTGMLHVGGVRTALFAWLLAKSNNGDFIVRIEDTDKAREVEGSVEQILESLSWLGIEWQEGPDKGGEYGPYRQSERLQSYKDFAQKLIDKGLAYADPYTPEEVERFRNEAKEHKQAFLYRNFRPENPPAWDGSRPLRFKVAEIKGYTWHDEVRGELSAGPEALDDFILIKSDGYPTYNFAHIIDDHLMKITHVLRGEEFIASMPKFLSLYDALEIERPVFATMPPILGKDGGKKLSKRDGAKSILEYRDEGYLPEAVLNFLATLGWNDGTEQEIYQPDELVAKFEIERIQKSPARFDDERLTWISGHHIRAMSLEELSQRAEAWWPETANNADPAYKQSVLGLVQERLKFFSELTELTEFFFNEPSVTATDLTVKQLDASNTGNYLDAVITSLRDSDFSEADIEKRLRELVDQLETKTGALFGLIRVAITGQKTAPGLFETIHVLGKEASLKRLEAAKKVAS